MNREDDNTDFALHYGNWCGDGWTAKQYKDSAELTPEDFNVEAVDALDQACKNHDIGLFLARTRADVAAVNAKFVQEATAAGIHGTIFAYLVKRFGPDEPGMSFLNFPCPSHVGATTIRKQQNT
jgi:hypothetical protein